MDAIFRSFAVRTETRKDSQNQKPCDDAVQKICGLENDGMKGLSNDDLPGGRAVLQSK